jgi:hypothetical protein
MNRQPANHDVRHRFQQEPVMRSKSASTTILDPYRAGLTLGAALADIAPEVVFLFCTMHYPSREELVEGLYDGLNDDSVILIGASGDGFLEQSQVADLGACALGLCSEGKVRWHLASAHGVTQHPQQALRGALAQLRTQMPGREAAFYYLLSDFNADASELEAVLSEEIPVPVIGGMAADDNSLMHRCALFANRQCLSDALVMLACDGPLAFQVHVGNTIAPVGNPGRIDAASGKTVQHIDGMPACAFVERETGKPFMRSDQGSVGMTILNNNYPGEKRLRAILLNSVQSNGAFKLHGGVQNGDQVQVCLANPAQLQQEVHTITSAARASGFEPSAALIVTCAGRKALLGGKILFEMQSLSDAFGQTLPIAGFPSFGEIAPLMYQGRPTRNLFHNMTYILLLLGH